MLTMISKPIRRPQATVATALIACALLGVGCDQGPKHFPVAGSVTLDGKPVPDGEIIFFPADGGPPDAGPIREGTFEFQSAAGAMRVQVTSTRNHPTRKVPGSSPGVWVPAPVNYIPDRYRGSGSELRVEIPPGGDHQIVFALQSEQ